jgi:hypothetical protein
MRSGQLVSVAPVQTSYLVAGNAGKVVLDRLVAEKSYPRPRLSQGQLEPLLLIDVDQP